MKPIELNLDLINNTDQIVPLNILGGVIYTNDICNQTTAFVYDFTGFSFTTENTLSLVYRPFGTNNFTTYIASLPSQDLAGIVSALNDSNIGAFFQYGTNNIRSYNDTYEFFSLNIYDNTVNEIQYSYFNYTVVSGFLYDLIISTPLPSVISANGTNTNGSSGVLGTTANFSVNFVTAPTEPSPVLLYIKQIPLINGAIAQDLPSTPISVPANTPVSYNFVASSNYQYVIQAGNP